MCRAFSECMTSKPVVPDLGKSEKMRNDLTLWASSFEGQQETLDTIQDLEKKLEIARLKSGSLRTAWI